MRRLAVHEIPGPDLTAVPDEDNGLPMKRSTSFAPMGVVKSQVRSYHLPSPI